LEILISNLKTIKYNPIYSREATIEYIRNNVSIDYLNKYLAIMGQ